MKREKQNKVSSNGMLQNINFRNTCIPINLSLILTYSAAFRSFDRSFTYNGAVIGIE